MKQIYSSTQTRAIQHQGRENGTIMARLWSKITGIKTLYTLLALLMVALFGVNENAWGGTWYAKIDAASNPSNGGYVYVGTNSNCSASNATKSTDSGENSASKSLKTSGDVNLWLCAKAKSGYIFKGWNTDQSNTVLSGSTAVPYKVTVHGTAKVFGIGGESYNYYAIFARLASSTASGSSINFEDVIVGDESGIKTLTINHAHAKTVTLSKTGDNPNDFELSESSFSSVAEGSKAITIKFKPTTNGLRTCTLTVSSNNGLSSLTYYLTGKGFSKPSITWVDANDNELTSGETTLSAGDVLRASCLSGQTISYSNYNTTYFTEGKDANNNPILTVREDISGTINGLSVTANVAKDNTNFNAANSSSFTLNVTNLTPQEIEWTDDISDLSNENMPYTITLSAVAKNAKTGAASGLPVTYSMASNASLSLSGNVLTVRALGGPIAITASVAGNDSYAPVSVTKYATVINMTDPCATSDNHNGGTLNKNSKYFDIYPTLPKQLTFRVTKSSNLFLADLEVIQYNANGTQLEKTTIGYGDISTSGTNRTINCNANTTRIRFNAGAYLGYSYTISNVKTTRNTTSSVSENALSYEVTKGQSLGKDVTITYSNIPVFLSFKSDEDANVSSGKSLWSLNTTHFGSCGKKGSQTVRVSFMSNKKGDFSDKLYVRNNVGDLLHTIDLTASVTAQNQFLEDWNIEDNYLTTDQIILNAVTRAGHSNFTFTAASSNPENIVTLANGVMTFTASGTATIKADLPEISVFEAFSTTHNITISKVTPNLTAPTSGTAIQYLQTLNNSTIANDGVAKVTLRGVANTEVAGSWAWSNPTQVIKDKAGTHSYEVTFTPTDGGMYTTNTCMVPVTILRAEQAIAMNNGTVKVAVDGIDEGKADSYLDLDNLIASQTLDVVNSVKRDGAVTYTVISDNKDNATIDANNIFSATKIGEYTIRATKAETEYYNTITADFKVTVSKRANTMAIAGTEYEKFVDEEIADIRSSQNSDATVQTSSTSPTIAYYDVKSNKILIPNSESDEQMFGAYKTVTIKIWQEATERFEACEKTIVLTVKKYVTASNGEDYIIKVNETKTANYGFTNTSAPYPSNNPEDDFYYTIDKPNFENEALNNGTELITYNPATNQITGHNAGTTKITFFQKETYKYTGATLMCNIAVEKRSNQISNSWNNTWQKAMSENGTTNISFSSTHGDYANYPIAIEQIYGADVATLTGDAAMASIKSNTTKGYAIWHLSQAENYEYYSAEEDVMVMVGVPAPPTCYVYEDNSEHKFSTSISDAEGHFETPITINSPIDKIWFKAKRQWGGVNYFAVQYSTDNGKTWGTVISPDLGKDYAEYSASFPTISGNKRITHVRFGAKTGATLSKWYKDVRISRKAYLTIQDAEQKKISKLPTMTCTIDETSTAEAKFYIDYSTCADEILIESSNPEHFTVSRKSINVSEKHDNLTSAKEEITVTYSSTELGTHNAVITVRTSYQTRALSVSGETAKRTPTLTWQEGYTNNPLTLPIGLTVNALNPAATTTSTASVMYESDNEDVVRITENGYAFKVVGAGSAKLTAIVPENEKWKSVSDTRVINATAKVVQEIVWNQTFPRFMEPGNVIDLDAQVFLRNLSTEAFTYSEERSRYITYSCPLNNGIVSISGNKMNILNYGEVKITASVSGNADYEAAASVTVLITVRQPSVGCETPLVLHKEDVIDMYEVNVDFSNYLNLTTEEMVSEEFLIDPAYGKPDKLSFQYEGEEFDALIKKYFGGYIKFEQRVNSQWIPVEGSRVETVKNEWNAKSGLQLDENADALRIIRESGATGHHYIKDIQVTRKQYLRATQNEINLGEITKGQATPVTIGFEYSDVKGDLTARTINNTTDVTIKNNGAIDIECGSLGHYDLPVTFTPSQVGDWKGTVEIYDNIANLSITVALKATVVANEEYIFNHEGNWNEHTNWTTDLVPGENADITVAKDMIINSAASVKSITIAEGATVTIKDGGVLTVGDGNTLQKGVYGNIHVAKDGQLKLGTGVVTVNDFILDAALGNSETNASSGQVQDDKQKMILNGNAYFNLSLDPSGTSTFGWYDFSVPFDVNATNGIYLQDGTKLTNNVNYAIIEFDEAKFNENVRAWKYTTGTLKPGKLYSITIADGINDLRLVKTSTASITATNQIAVTSSAKANPNYQGWNGLGNTTLRYAQVGLKTQIFDHNNSQYIPMDANECSFVVGSAFFVQVQNPGTVDLTTSGTKGLLRVAQRYDEPNEEFMLTLNADGKQQDRLFVSAEESASNSYEIEHDLVKFGTPTDAKVAQIWANAYGMKLCDIEAPVQQDVTIVDISLFAPKNGEYNLAIAKQPDEQLMFLMKDEMVIWNLSMSDCAIDLNQGVNEGYKLMIYRAPAVSTDIENVQDMDNQGSKLIIGGHMYIFRDGKIYDAQGRSVK